MAMGVRLALVLALLAGAAGPPDRVVAGRPDQWPAQAPGDELKLAGRVTDAAGLFTPEARARIDSRLAAYERRTGHQFVVVTVPSLGGSEIGLFSVRLLRRWAIGRRGINDGLGLVIAPNERRVRIEVGYGLETALRDEQGAEILRTVTLPHFRIGDFGGGAEATVAAVIAAIDRKERGGR